MHLMLCLHLGIYRGKHLLTKPWYICTVFILAEITEVNLSSMTITIKSANSKIHALNARVYKRSCGSCSPRVFFLVIELQTQVSIFQRLLLLQHLKKSRRKRSILLQIALRKTRRARRACHGHGRETNSGLKPFYTEIFCNFCFLP